MRKISLAALRAHWASAAGVFLTMLLAATLVSASGILLESGLRAPDEFSATAMMLPAMMGSFGGVAVMIAVFVVSSAFAAALRDRRREFALLRAVGATSRQVRSLISTEVMAISLVAVVLGGVAGFAGARACLPLLRSGGMIDDGFTLAVSPWPVLAAALLLIPAAWIAGLLAAREMARLSPTSAVSTTAADARTLGSARVAGAWIFFFAGLGATSTPVFIPGALGGAAGAASALLFITAVALAGPALVQRGAAWLAERRVLLNRAPSVLATANARGFSRRLTAAVVPLALLVSLGMVQAGTNGIIADAAGEQLGDAIQGDLVWQGPGEHRADALETLSRLPGVSGVGFSDTATVQAKVESGDSEMPFADGLTWEPASVMELDDATANGLIDPDVSEGGLAALTGPDTVAVSSDALAFTGKGVGDTVDVRYADGTETALTIVAIFERGLALGSFIVGAETLAAAAPGGNAPTAVVAVAPGEQQAVVDAASQAGLDLVPTDEYVASALQSGDGETDLSTALLLALLVFIAIAAGNALVVATRSRTGEFTLLGRLGATRRQLRTMLTIEAALVGAAAVALGALTALPGLVAASLALTRGLSMGVEPVMFAGLAGTAVVVSFLGTSGARLRTQAV